MSPCFNPASERVTFCSVRMFTICAETVSSEPISSGFSSGEPTLTAMITSGRQRLRASSMGRLSTRPPSTSLRPLYSTGASSPGTDMLARIARVRLPSRNTTRSPLPMSVAMIESGSGSCSMLRSPRSECTSWLRNSLIFWPPTTPPWYCTPLTPTPVSDPGRKRREIVLFRYDSSE